MFRVKAIRPGSLCVRQSCEPGSGLARRARGTRSPSKASYRAWWSFLMRASDCPRRPCSRGPSSFHARGKASKMVAASVPRLFFEPQVCLARPLLLEALGRYEKDDFIGAGIRLRECVRRFLVAALQWHAVPLTQAMKRDKYARTATLAKALRDAKQIDQWGFEIILECLAVGNAAAHCRPFCKRTLKGGISMMFCMLDCEPFSADTARVDHPQPANDWDCDCDCDDDDGANWWKSEGGAV